MRGGVGMPPRNSRWRIARQVIGRMYTEVTNDQIGLLAAGIAFYALLAIFPAMTSILAILGIFFSAGEITGPVATATASMPPSAAQLITDQASSIVSSDSNSLSIAAGIGLAVAIYSIARGMRHLIQGLNVAFGRRESRNIFILWFIILVLSIFVISGVLLGMGAIAVIPAILKFVPLDLATQSWISLARWLVLFTISTVGIAIIYRFGPDRHHHRWHWTLPGAFLACLLWVTASAGFSIYAENFASYQESFGALTGVIVLLTWLWISAYVLLLGAELNAALEAVLHARLGDRASGSKGGTEAPPSDAPAE